MRGPHPLRIRWLLACSVACLGPIALAVPVRAQIDLDGSGAIETDAVDAASPSSVAKAAPADDDSGVAALVAVSVGATERAIDLPTERGLTQLSTGLVPALGLQLRAQTPASSTFVAVILTYRSSIFAKATQERSNPDDEPLTTTIHTHLFQGGILPGLRLGDGPAAASVGLFVGYGIRALASVIELRMPRFSIHGPLLRLELELPLGTPRFVLRVAPEAQLILGLSRDLRLAGSLGNQALSLGGEASARFQISEDVAARLAYREAHAFASSAFGGEYTDVERFIMLDAVWRYF